MSGLLDDPQDVGLLSLGLRLMSTPGRFGQAFGQAGLGAVGDYQHAQDRQGRRTRQGLQDQLGQLQLQQAQRQALEDVRRQQERPAWMQSMPRAHTDSTNPQQILEGGEPNKAGYNPSAQDYLEFGLRGLDIDPPVANAAFKMADTLEARQAKDEQFQTLRADKKEQLEAERARRMEELQLRLEDRRTSAADRAALQRELTRMQIEGRRDLANVTRAMRPEPAPTLATIDDPASPGKGMVVDARTMRRIGGAPPSAADNKITADAGKARQNASEVLALLDQAEKLIPQSTGSYLGAAADQGMRAFGVATKGAEAIAQLKAVEGALMAKMPRMEGPQSNYDVALYRQSAGQIGDATTPNSARLQAIKTVREIQMRYGGAQGGATGSWDQNADPLGLRK